MIGASHIPSRLRRRPLDRRGLVVPYVQFIADDGEPNFAVLDRDKTCEALRRRLCGICGGPMGRHVHFVGGPATVTNHYFYDPPMHRECAVYALETCPHMARSKGRYGEPPASIDGQKIIVGKMDVSKKVDHYALMHTTSYQHGFTEEGMIIIRAGPWIDVEYWKNGKVIGKAIEK